MQARTFVSILILVTWLLIVVPPSLSLVHAQSNTPPRAELADMLVRRMIARINRYRQTHGCGALTANAKLMRAAQTHSDDMKRNNFFGHVNLRGESPLQRITAQGYDFLWVGENIAGWNPDPEYVVDRWYDETPPNDLHRKNLLKCEYQHVGVGYSFIENESGNARARNYWVLNLGQPSARELANALTQTVTPTPAPTATNTPSSVTCNGKPSSPGLIRPWDNTRFTFSNILLDWSDVPCATRYVVIVRRDGLAGKRVARKAQLTVSEYTTSALESGVTYVWRVRACNRWGCSPRSAVQRFTILRSAPLK